MHEPVLVLADAVLTDALSSPSPQSTGAFVDELDLGVHRFWSIAIPVSGASSASLSLRRGLAVLVSPELTLFSTPLHTVATTVLFGWGYLAEIINRFGRDILRMKHRIVRRPPSSPPLPPRPRH